MLAASLDPGGDLVFAGLSRRDAFHYRHIGIGIEDWLRDPGAGDRRPGPNA